MKDALPVDADAVHAPFADRRTRLNAHDQRMHVKRVPSNMSLYETEGAILGLEAGHAARTRWRADALMALTPEARRQAKDLLSEAGGFGELALRQGPSPWREAALATPPEAQVAVDATNGSTSRRVRSASR